jgi:hypothetical protein
MNERVIFPELLDELPATDPRAARSRVDLRRLNWWMGHGRILADVLARRAAVAPPDRIVDLGAGDGTFCASVLHRLPRRPDTVEAVEVILVDRGCTVSDRLLEAMRAQRTRPRFVQAEVVEWLEAQRLCPPPGRTWMMANLFLHHFAPHRLQTLLAAASPWVDLFCACEPRRAWLAGAASRLLWAMGANEVTRHDAVVSVDAGFRGHELSALWPRSPRWECHERPAGLFSHLFWAARKSDVPSRVHPGGG